MRRRNRKIIGLLTGVLVLAALAAALFAVRRMAARQDARESAATLVIEATADQIKAIRYVPSGGREVAFERREGLWVSTSDPDVKPDQTQVGILAASVTGIAVTQTIEDVEDLAQYGLETPWTTLVVTDMDGDVTELAIGDTSETAMVVYCCKNGDTSTVYAVSTGLTVCLDKTIDDYVEESTGSEVESMALTEMD